MVSITAGEMNTVNLLEKGANVYKTPEDIKIVKYISLSIISVIGPEAIKSYLCSLYLILKI